MQTIAERVIDNINADRNALQLIENLQKGIEDNQFGREARLLTSIGFDVVIYVINKTFGRSEPESVAIVRVAKEWTIKHSAYVHLNSSIMGWYEALCKKYLTRKDHLKRRMTKKERAKHESIALITKLIKGSQCLDEDCYNRLLAQTKDVRTLDLKGNGIIQILIKEAADVLCALDGKKRGQWSEYQGEINAIITKTKTSVNCLTLN